MEIKTKKGNTVELYDSIMQMPIDRYQMFNKLCAIDVGIGSSMNDVIDHFAKFDKFLSKGDIERVKIERNNLQYNMFSIIENIDTRSECFLCFVISIDGEPIGDISDDNIRKKAVRLLSKTGITVKDVSSLIDDLKKKLMLS